MWLILVSGLNLIAFKLNSRRITECQNGEKIWRKLWWKQGWKIIPLFSYLVTHRYTLFALFTGISFLCSLLHATLIWYICHAIFNFKFFFYLNVDKVWIVLGRFKQYTECGWCTQHLRSRWVGFHLHGHETYRTRCRAATNKNKPVYHIYQENKS